jgi:hypothetical protein
MTPQQEMIQHLIDEAREALDRIESLASKEELDFFKPSDGARLRAVIRRLTMRVEKGGGW